MAASQRNAPISDLPHSIGGLKPHIPSDIYGRNGPQNCWARSEIVLVPRAQSLGRHHCVYRVLRVCGGNGAFFVLSQRGAGLCAYRELCCWVCGNRRGAYGAKSFSIAAVGKVPSEVSFFPTAGHAHGRHGEACSHARSPHRTLPLHLLRLGHGATRGKDVCAPYA